jgi:hypothetical protein
VNNYRVPQSLLLLLLVLPVACGGANRFPLRDPFQVDTDLRSVSVGCRADPTPKDKQRVNCTPKEYVSPLNWDGMDNLFFRPFAELWTFEAEHEAPNANSLDEVADSAWFTKRIGAHPMSIEELTQGACTPSQVIEHPEDAPDGSWVIDHGKDNGASEGFRIKIAGKGKFLLKSDAPGIERSTAASAIGAAAYNAVGFFTTCEQVVYVKRSVFKLTPGLKVTNNTGVAHPFDQAALDKVLNGTNKKGEYLRFSASAWLDGQLLGPFRYEKTRSDDPNDVIPHEDRRELRGGRLLAAWLDHFDAREQNSMDIWFADRKDEPESSPGRVIHYYLDTSDILGSEWDWPQISRRLGYSYVLDWGDVGRDFFTLGIPMRPWDEVQYAKGHELFAYFNLENFVPDQWKNEYPNPAFSRMTERDGAWMARILARFTPDMVDALAKMGQFSDPSNAIFVADVLEGRLKKILARYLTRLSPLADVHIEDDRLLCATDLAAKRWVRSEGAFHYGAEDGFGRPLSVEQRAAAAVCVNLPHVAPDRGPPDDDSSRYLRVSIRDGVAKGPLVAHLYDLGPTRGFRLVGLERPER